MTLLEDIWVLLTVIVNLLYGNSRGINEKKLSLYCPQRIATSATSLRIGLSTGGNLLFCSNDSEIEGSVNQVRLRKESAYPY